MIQVEFLIGIGRNRTPEVIHQKAHMILSLYLEGLISGVGLAGYEQGFPVKPLHQTFALFHEAGLPIEIHAGEWCGPESVWDALEYGFPTRIGHGVSLFKDPRLIEFFQERRIHLEMYPTSNLKTGSIFHLIQTPWRPVFNRNCGSKNRIGVFAMESATGNSIYLLCISLALLVTMSLLLALAIRIVPEYQRLVIFRLGRFIGMRGPGLVFVLPSIDRSVKVDLREQVPDIKEEIASSRDQICIQGTP